MEGVEVEAVVADLLEAGTQTELPQHPDSETLQAGEKIVIVIVTL